MRTIKGSSFYEVINNIFLFLTFLIFICSSILYYHQINQGYYLAYYIFTLKNHTTRIENSYFKMLYNVLTHLQDCNRELKLNIKLRIELFSTVNILNSNYFHYEGEETTFTTMKKLKNGLDIVFFH